MPSYRSRLRVEGLVLAASGALACVAVLAVPDGATDKPVSTAVQLGAVALFMASAGRWSVFRAMAGAAPSAEGTGEPTALWVLPLIVAGLTLAFSLPTGAWDAGLRVGGGCVIVGLAQAVLFERIVAARERRDGRCFYRVPGSSVLTGTRLGTLPCPAKD